MLLNEKGATEHHLLPTLTDKQRQFVDWYCSSDARCNGTEAARRAGYRGNDNTLRAVASENLTKPNKT